MAGRTSDVGRTRNAEATREALLRAATKRFTLLGYERTTTRDVAGDAGVNISLIARYFGGKEGLFAAVLDESTLALGADRERDDQVDLATSIVEGMQRGHWPEFGDEHPLLLLVSASEASPEVGLLRRRALDAAVEHIEARMGARSTVRGGLAPSGRREARRQAELVLAAVIGVLTVRRIFPDGALATGDPDGLRASVDRLLDAVQA